MYIAELHKGKISIYKTVVQTTSSKTYKVASFNNVCVYIKQIMTGLEGNRQIYLPREIQDRLPNSFY